MDPIIGGSLISAGSSLLGGLFGGNSGPTAGDTRRHTVAGIMGQAQGAREASEAWGFNPLTLLGASSAIYPSASGGGSLMGQAIANAGLAIADGMTEASAQKAYLSKLEEQNADLRKALDGQTLRPKMPGIYGTPTPTVGVAGPQQVPGTAGVPYSLGVVDPGTVLETGPGDMPTFVRGEVADRPEQINPVLNENWLKKVNIGGRTVYVWNDEAAESELAATVSIASVPLQLGAQVLSEAASNNAAARFKRLERKALQRGRQKLPNDSFPGQHPLKPLGWDGYVR